MELTDTQIKIIEGKICPYYKQPTAFIDSLVVYGKSYGMIYACEPCGAYVGVHKGTSRALGRLANPTLRKLKKQAHGAFDLIWKENIMSRSEAYAWLFDKVGLPQQYTHIGMFGEDTCRTVIQEATNYLQSKLQ